MKNVYLLIFAMAFWFIVFQFAQIGFLLLTIGILIYILEDMAAYKKEETHHQNYTATKQ